MTFVTKNIENKNKVRMILGLGNPGRGYSQNRHNFGYMVLDHMVEKWNMGFRAIGGAYVYADTRDMVSSSKNLKHVTILCKPVCYMNNSGIAIRQASEYFECTPENILVVYDDIDLRLGKLRVRSKGSAGGHNGVKSVIEKLGVNTFPRLKLGIGPQGQGIPAEDFVLDNFREDEISICDEVIETAASVINDFVNYDISTVMAKYNGLKIDEKTLEEVSQ